MPVSQSSAMQCFCGLLAAATLCLSGGCAKTEHKIHPLITETPAFSKMAAASEESNLSQKSPDELINAGFAYLAAGNATLARLHFVSALKRNPEAAWAYVGIGDIAYQSGDYLSALANYQQASALAPDNLSALLGQAQSLRQQGKLSATSEVLNQAMKLAPNDVRVLTELAINYDLQGQVTLAGPLYQEIAAKSPDQAGAYNNMGINALSQNNYATAIIHFSKAFMLDGNNERITNNLAMAFALYGQEDQALRLFTKTVGEAAAWNNLGYLYMTQKRYDDAERALKKALELNPKFYARAQENLDRVERLRLTGSP